MTYTITADSYPDYDEDLWDDYWKIPEWQIFYDKLVEKYGATEGSKKWLEFWWKSDTTSHNIQNETKLKDWAMSKGLWKSYTMFSSSLFKPSEFIPPQIANQGQLVTTIDPKTGLPVTSLEGVQPDLRARQAENEKKKEMVSKGLLIGGGVLLVGFVVIYFVLKSKSKAQ